MYEFKGFTIVVTIFLFILVTGILVIPGILEFLSAKQQNKKKKYFWNYQRLLLITMAIFFSWRAFASNRVYGLDVSLNMRQFFGVYLKGH
ncbi:MAG: hypothetical protein PHS31_10460 [Victivallaceae bacterium]|nr:hypothetical protein [Victivallaceae bacterium]MDD4180072.1 hypothetical protein [Victivallaceae bacterium]